MEDRTPLHRAVKYGNEKIVSLLLENDANPNHQSVSGKTPLHRAALPKNVQLLFNHDANPNIRNKSDHSAFYGLLRQNDETAKVALDAFITTNDKDMESSDLLLVYDLDLFRHGKHEMSKHADMIACDSQLLFHPLSEAMTRLKWECQSKINYGFIILKLLFCASLTRLVTQEFGWESTRWKLGTDRNCNQSFLGMNGTESNPEEMLSSSFKKLELKVVYCLAFFSILILLLREFSQGLGTTIDYFKNYKNWLDLTMIASTIAYLTLEFDYFFNFNVSLVQLPSRKFAAIGILLAWTDLVLLLGGMPRVGIYVYMFTNVSKTLLFFIMIYSPALMGFALCFYVLMPKEGNAFQNPWNSSLKILAMLIGELDYEETFMINTCSTENTTNLILAQIISIFFLCFASIVIMNLLVGLTVNEMEKLKFEAWQASVKTNVSKLIQSQKFRCHEKRKKREHKSNGDGHNILCCICRLYHQFGCVCCHKR